MMQRVKTKNKNQKPNIYKQKNIMNLKLEILKFQNYFKHYQKLQRHWHYADEKVCDKKKTLMQAPYPSFKP